MKFWPMKSVKATTLEPDKYLFEPKDDITAMELAKLMRCVCGAAVYDYEIKAMPPEVRRHFDLVNPSKVRV